MYLLVVGSHFAAPIGPVFGAPLRESLRYANVPISTANGKDGVLYIYGYVPVVVAKWHVTVHSRSFVWHSTYARYYSGLYLKETSTEVEGTFRINGSARRMRELQAEFETPPKVRLIMSHTTVA